jgi:hypothetical protein
MESAMQTLLNCACVSLGQVGWEGECCLEPAMVVWDQCCEDGGKAWARLINIYPSASFPGSSPPADPTKCETQWAMNIELGAITCICFELCDCEVRAANVTKVMDMTAAMMQAMACCADSCGLDVRVGTVTTNSGSDDGSCAGVTMQVVVPLANFCCPA